MVNLKQAPAAFLSLGSQTGNHRPLLELPFLKSQMVNPRPLPVLRSPRSRRVNHRQQLRVPQLPRSQMVNHKQLLGLPSPRSPTASPRRPLAPLLLKSLTANLRLQLKLLPTLLLHPQLTLAPPTVKVFLAVLPSSPVLPELLLSSSRLADPLLQCDDE